MPLLLSRSDLRPVAADDGSPDDATDTVEAERLRDHATDSDQACRWPSQLETAWADQVRRAGELVS